MFCSSIILGLGDRFRGDPKDLAHLPPLREDIYWTFLQINLPLKEFLDLSYSLV